MDVHSEGVRFPASHFHDGFCVSAGQMEGHGAPSSEGVTADIGRFTTTVEQTSGMGGKSDGVVNVVRGHKAGLEEEWVFDPVDWALLGAEVLHDVVHAAGE